MVFLYGPPAVGKLTVANAVAELAGFRVLHNHLTIDAVLPVFEFGTPPFHRLVGLFRRELIAAAAEEGLDVVCTFVFASGEEDIVAELVAPYEGRVTFVQLVASPAELRRRVVSDSRRAHGKIRDVETLDAILRDYDCFEVIAGRETLTLDMELLTADEAADRIVEAIA
jgi:hypothetical protein